MLCKNADESCRDSIDTENENAIAPGKMLSISFAFTSLLRNETVEDYNNNDNRIPIKMLISDEL
jgi:hypothetical protein